MYKQTLVKPDPNEPISVKIMAFAVHFIAVNPTNPERSANIFIFDCRLDIMNNNNNNDNEF